MNKKSMTEKIARAKRTRLGRALCKLAGDKTGGVMMEYVILALLIGAAVVVAVAVFSKAITGGADAAGKAMLGNPEEAKTALEDARTEQNDSQTQAKEHHSAITTGK